MQPLTLIIALLALFSAGAALGGEKTIVSPPSTRPGGNYSQGILIDGALYISGQGAAGPPYSMSEMARQVAQFSKGG